MGTFPTSGTVARRPTESPVLVRRTLIMLPPSEGKADGGRGAPWSATATATGPMGELRRSAAGALTALVRDPGVDHGRALGLSGGPLEHALQVNAELATAPTRPAIERYTGIVAEGLGYDQATAPARARARSSIHFVSALWGVVAATEPIPDYRCKTGAQLPGLGKAGTWWRGHLGPVVTEAAAGAFVWDLLTIEHRRLVADATLSAHGTLEATQGGGPVTNYHGKWLKGCFVRHLIDHGRAAVSTLGSFDADGWRVDGERSVLAGSRLHVHLHRA